MEVMETETPSENFCENFTCSLCGYETTKLRKIEKHFRKLHAVTELLQCPFCKYIITEEALFSQHKQAVHPKGKFVCAICKFSTKKWTRWKKHVMGGHSQSKGRGDGANQEMKNTLRQQNFPDNGIKNFSDISSISKQMKQPVTNVIDEKLQPQTYCPFCKENFKTPSELYIHIFNHTFDSPYSCQHCSYCCSDEDLLIKHTSFVHECQNHFIATFELQATKHLKKETQLQESKEVHLEESYDDTLKPLNTESQNGKRTLKATSRDAIITKYIPLDKVTQSNGSVDLMPVKNNERKKHHCELLDESEARDGDMSNVLLTQEHTSLKTSADIKQKHVWKLDFSLKCLNSDDQDRDDCVAQPLSEDSTQGTDSQSTGDLQVLRNQTQIHKSRESQKNLNVLKQFTCEHCNKTYKHKSSFKRHMSTAHENEMSFVCKICSRVYKTMKSLKRHSVIHTNEGAYRCEVCDKSFMYKSQLVLHTAVHVSQQTLVCQKCDRSFKRKVDLTRHINSLLCSNSFVCEYCDQSFSFQQALKEHILSHTDEWPHVCTFCDKRFKSELVLKQHENLHTGGKLHTCEYCHKSFLWKKILTEHIRIHTGEKPFKCSYCNYAACQSGALRIHERSHRNERPYRCDVCDFKAVNSGTLTNHYRIHTGERPYQCEVCLKHFRRSDTMKIHMRRKHLTL